jgi:hypothetical protein
LSHLLLPQFHLLGLQEFLWHTSGTALGTQAQLPELFAESWCFFLEKAGKLDLELLDVWLKASAGVN